MAVNEGILLGDVSHLRVRTARRKLLDVSGIIDRRDPVPVRGHDGCVECPWEEIVILCPVGQRYKAAHLSIGVQVHFGPKTEGVRIVVWSQVRLPSNLTESI